MIREKYYLAIKDNYSTQLVSGKAEIQIQVSLELPQRIQKQRNRVQHHSTQKQAPTSAYCASD